MKTNIKIKEVTSSVLNNKILHYFPYKCYYKLGSRTSYIHKHISQNDSWNFRRINKYIHKLKKLNCLFCTYNTPRGTTKQCTYIIPYWLSSINCISSGSVWMVKNHSFWKNINISLSCNKLMNKTVQYNRSLLFNLTYLF